MVEIPILVIALLDLQNTTMQVSQIEIMLEAAKNKRITLIPLKMEGVNQVYYRGDNLDTYVGAKYTGLTDDRRALRAFVSGTFDRISRVLAGREKIIILHSEDYEAEGKMMEVLAKGQRPQSPVIRSESADFVLGVISGNVAE